MAPSAVRPLAPADADACEQLFVRARDEYASYSPVFWNPAANAAETHPGFIGFIIGLDTTVALGVGDLDACLIAAERPDGFVIDDFTVADPAFWPTAGRQLLDVALAEIDGAVTVVCGVGDKAKSAMLLDAGLTVARHWWIGLTDGSASAAGPVLGAEAIVIDAPPVYDPGGQVAMTTSWDGAPASLAALRASVADTAVLVILPIDARETGRQNVAAEVGFIATSAWYQLQPFCDA